jgi:hypothetical protein
LGRRLIFTGKSLIANGKTINKNPPEKTAYGEKEEEKPNVVVSLCLLQIVVLEIFSIAAGCKMRRTGAKCLENCM